MITIPRVPYKKILAVSKRWDGEPCPNPRLEATVALSAAQDGLRVEVVSSVRGDERAPDVEVGTRVDGLWEYDVVELFLVGENGHYFELELGAGGHFLALSFDGVRQRSDEHTEWKPAIAFQKGRETWKSAVTIPWSMLPTPIARLNAFMIADGEYLAMSPLPDEEPNFHQPSRFPEAKIEA